jgi:hypothetical protein
MRRAWRCWGLGVAACEQYSVGLQTRAFVGQRFVRIRQPAGQHSVRMGQLSGAKGLQTRPWANTECEQGERLANHSLGSRCIRSPCSLQVKRPVLPERYVQRIEFPTFPRI